MKQWLKSHKIPENYNLIPKHLKQMFNKHLKQMFNSRIEECSRKASRCVNMYKDIHVERECITDQSNWSGPYSLVVVCLLCYPQLGHFFTDFSPPTICFVHFFLFILIDSSFFIFLFLFLPPKSTF